MANPSSTRRPNLLYLFAPASVGLAPISFEVNRLLKKWTFLSLAAIVAVIGCGGNGGGGGTGSTSTTSTTGIPGTNLRVNLGNTGNTSYGAANFYYLTGQGRGRSRAFGDLIANIREITLEDEYGSVNNPGAGTGATFNLAAFQVATLRVDIPFTNQNSRLFESYTLRFNSFTQEGIGTALGVPDVVDFPARIRVFPGRDTTIPIFLDDAMFEVSSNVVSFDPSRFEMNNLSGTPPAIQAFIGDYVQFDLTNVPAADRPQLLSGEFAGRFFISGDNFALGQQASAGSFEVLTEDDQRFQGTYGPENTINAYTPGTYTLYQSDPSDISGIAKIVSIAGSWKSSTRVLSNAGSFEIITFPNVKDASHQEMVAATFNGNGNVTSLYFGFLDLDRGQFELHPIKTITDPTDFTGFLTGTLSNYRVASGGSTASPNAVRYGSYTFDAGQTLPTGFRNTGTFVVFRK